MKTRALTIHVAPEEARAYEAASPAVQREVDQALRQKLRETLRQGVPRGEEPLLSADVDPDTAVDKILALLSEDRYQTARQTAAEAVGRFPEHPRVREAWGIFEIRGKASVGTGGPEPSRSAEFDWLRKAPESLRGQWVALVGKDLVGSADTLEELTRSLAGKTFSRTPLVHRID